MTLQTRIRAPGEVMSTQLDGEMVLMHVSKGEYFGLDEVGTFVWELLSQPVSIGQLCSAVEEEFDVAPDLCESDILSLIERLEDEDLVEIVVEEV